MCVCLGEAFCKHGVWGLILCSVVWGWLRCCNWGLMGGEFFRENTINERFTVILLWRNVVVGWSKWDASFFFFFLREIYSGFRFFFWDSPFPYELYSNTIAILESR